MTTKNGRGGLGREAGGQTSPELRDSGVYVVRGLGKTVACACGWMVVHCLNPPWNVNLRPGANRVERVRKD